MKISRIENDGIYWLVLLKPNFIERLFGMKTKISKFKSTGDIYTFGGGYVYLCENGEYLGSGNPIGKAIDKHRRKF